MDKCVFYCRNVIYVLKTDDAFLAGPNPNETDQDINDIEATKINITNEGDIQDFLGVKFFHKPDTKIHPAQPNIIDQILDDLKIIDGNYRVNILFSLW